ncbi:MAG TPA: 50S ribosomal protein L14 [Chitinophagaceae bacterium]|nr:50S ribosomal protein L14 [Chitinophagaceae bacterium]
MIQKGSYFRVIDNSGAKKACCIHVLGGYRKRYGKTGDIVVVSIKSLRTKRRETSKIKKGDVTKALIVKTKVYRPSYSQECVSFFENSVVLLNNQNKLLGTRIFGPVQKEFRYTKYLRILSLASGVIK